MKTSFLFLLLMLSCFWLNAQEDASSAVREEDVDQMEEVPLLAEIVLPAGQEVKCHELAGIWQFCLLEQKADGYHLKLLPVMKFLSPDQTFVNVLAANNRIVVTNQGTYTVKSETLYVEEILKTAYTNIIPGTRNDISYEFLHDRLMKVSFFIGLTEGNGLGSEFWYRVCD